MYCANIPILLERRILQRAFSRIWRKRSLDKPSEKPISSSPSSLQPMPKLRNMISLSLAVRIWLCIAAIS